MPSQVQKVDPLISHLSFSCRHIVASQQGGDLFYGCVYFVKVCLDDVYYTATRDDGSANTVSRHADSA